MAEHPRGWRNAAYVKEQAKALDYYAKRKHSQPKTGTRGKRPGPSKPAGKSIKGQRKRPKPYGKEKETRGKRRAEDNLDSKADSSMSFSRSRRSESQSSRSAPSRHHSLAPSGPPVVVSAARPPPQVIKPWITKTAIGIGACAAFSIFFIAMLIMLLISRRRKQKANSPASSSADIPPAYYVIEKPQAQVFMPRSQASQPLKS